MYVLNIWHNVNNYAEWKSVFDTDPLGREASGARRVVIERPLDDESMVVGHLEFESLDEAESFAGRLQELWSGSAASMVSNAGYTITEILDQQQLGEAGRRAA